MSPDWTSDDTPERQKALDFTDPYYYTSGQVFVKKGGPQITGVNSLVGRRVGLDAMHHCGFHRLGLIERSYRKFQ